MARRVRHGRVPVLAAVAVWAAGCARPDVARPAVAPVPVRAAAPTVGSLPTFEEQRRSFTWGSGVVDLSTGYRSGERILAVLRGTSLSDTFLVDTGSTHSYVSSTSSLGPEVRVSTDRYGVRGAIAGTGPKAVLREVRWGGLAARDMVLGVIERSNTPDVSWNILGMAHLAQGQVEHAGGAWRFRVGAHRLPAREPGWRVARFDAGLKRPLVRLRGPDGRIGLALVDSGEPRACVVVNGAPPGRYALLGEEGETILEVDGVDGEAFRDRPQEGQDVKAFLGMGALRTRDWRLTFDQGTWAFPP
jgi:hypothetical protein